MPKPLPQSTGLAEFEEQLRSDPSISPSSVAQEYGFLTWKQLARFLEMRDEGQFALTESADEFLALACLNYSHSDSPDRRRRGQEMLSAAPKLVETSIHTASCVGDAALVGKLLDRDSTLVQERGGPFDWPPLMYVCYSRVFLESGSPLETARMLLQHGADPNAYYMWGGQYRFTALTGVFGEGESGPSCLPEHPSCGELARLLLDAGADANDGQALYNRMFTPDSSCLELLLEYGLSIEDRCNWLLQGDGEFFENPQPTLHYQLGYAIRHNFAERAKRLIDHGAHRCEVSSRQDHPYYMAMLAGQREIADYLVENGLEPITLSPFDQITAALMSGDAAVANSLVSKEPALRERFLKDQSHLLCDVAGANQRPAAAALIDFGLEINLRDRPSPLHQAAWNGHVDMVAYLLSRGADPMSRDPHHDATPADWAQHAGHVALADQIRHHELSSE